VQIRARFVVLIASSRLGPFCAHELFNTGILELKSTKINDDDEDD